ncbi:hypothetical protein ACTFIW_005467 [Dictyostelium discoideum]
MIKEQRSGVISNLELISLDCTVDAEQITQLLLNHVFGLRGYPRTIVSDIDPRFLKDIWEIWNGENWSDIIPFISFAMNSSMSYPEPEWIKEVDPDLTDASESAAGATLKKGNKVIKTWSFQWLTTQSIEQVIK